MSAWYQSQPRQILADLCPALTVLRVFVVVSWCASFVRASTRSRLRAYQTRTHALVNHSCRVAWRRRRRACLSSSSPSPLLECTRARKDIIKIFPFLSSLASLVLCVLRRVVHRPKTFRHGLRIAGAVHCTGACSRHVHAHTLKKAEPNIGVVISDALHAQRGSCSYFAHAHQLARIPKTTYGKLE